MKRDLATQSVAEAYLELLASRGIEFLFGNAGTDFPPIIEAYARAKKTGARVPTPVLVPHENVAVAMAYGYTMATGRMQAVMVHVGLGTANALCGLFNAARQNIPMLFTAGRTPWTESGAPGARNNYINWAQEMFDQGAMVRELMKWDFELRHPAHLEGVVDRALAMAQAAPAGPVYLVLPREVLAAEHSAQRSARTTLAPASPAHPDPARLAEVRDLLARARRPVLITADAGRTDAGWRAMERFASAQRVPVVQYRPRYASLPTEHPMHAGYDPAPYLRDADLVLVLECDVPWIPEHFQPPAQAKVVHLGADPLYARYPLRGFRSDLTIAGDAAAILEGLCAPSERSPGLEKKRPAPASGRMTNLWVSHCIDRAKDDDTVVINEYPLALEALSIRKPGTYFSHSPAGGLGWAMGAALGVKLARREATVIACVGDGTYMFGNPTPFHFVSRAQGLPVLTVVFNNRRWGAVHRSTLSLYPEGHASQEHEPPFSTLEPAPDYEKIVEASGGYGERVEDPAALPGALSRALKAVREDKRQAVLNIITEIDYARTS
ncbi:MAG TPA: thiamine pyrophosphate-requiring protein [Burkholderiales bacterium]|nr:thiamine pyrophosphate-requiring protein [Burkholderiales bacterium]